MKHFKHNEVQALLQDTPFSKSCSNLFKPSKLAQACSNSFKLVQTCSSQFKLTQTCTDLLKSVKTCLGLFDLAKTCSNLFKLAEAYSSTIFQASLTPSSSYDVDEAEARKSSFMQGPHRPRSVVGVAGGGPTSANLS